MGRYIVKVPDIGEGTTEAEIIKWHVTPGQEIREEDPLVDVMTDKATVELPSPRDQIATKELPEFTQLRAHVYRLIRREQQPVEQVLA